MSFGFEFGIGMAVATAFFTNLAFLCKHRGAVEAPDVDITRPWGTVVDLFKSKWWSIGWGIAVIGFLAHVVALAFAPISIVKAVISGGFVLLAVLAERFFGFNLGLRQWAGVVLVAVSLGLIAVTGGGGGDHESYSMFGMILFQGLAVAIGIALIFADRLRRARSHYAVLLGAAAGLGFGVSDVAIKAVASDMEGILGIVSPWAALALAAGIFSFYASARSLQLGDGVAVIAITSVAANLSAILAGIVVFGDPLGDDALTVIGRTFAFVMVVVAGALMPAPVRAADAVGESSPAESAGSGSGGQPVPEPA